MASRQFPSNDPTKRLTTSGMPFGEITPAQLARMLEQHPDIFLLDVREPFELIAFGAIPHVINIPMGELTNRLQDLPSDTAHRIVTICQSGSRSFEVAQFLSRKGYTQVYNLDGGTSGWMYAGRPMAAAKR